MTEDGGLLNDPHELSVLAPILTRVHHSYTRPSMRRRVKETIRVRARMRVRVRMRARERARARALE